MFLRFSIPVPEERTLFPYGQSREIVAKVSESIPDPEFVQYILWSKPDRTPRSALPPFRYTTAQRGRALDIIALGQPAVEALLAKGHLISKAIAQEFGKPVADGRQLGICSIQSAPTLTHYRIPRMVIQKYQYESLYKEAEVEHKSGNRSTVLCDHVAQVILRDLLRQAELMAIDFPTDVDIDNVRLEHFIPVKVVDKRYNLSASIEFSMTHKLAGPWAVGHLASRGYGRILPALRRGSAYA
jgi:hypothetical protein